MTQMLNYNKNRLINQCLQKYYETFAQTLDTADYVPESYNKKILGYIFNNLQKSFKKLDKADKRYQRQLKRRMRREKRANKKLAKQVKRTIKEQ